MKNNMKTKLIQFNVENKNGRIYLSEEFTKIRKDENGIEYTELDRLNKMPIYGQLEYGDEFETPRTKATHSVSNIEIVDGWLVGDITILDESVKLLDNVVFRSRSIGELNDDKTVKIDKVLSFDAIPESTDAFIEIK